MIFEEKRRKRQLETWIKERTSVLSYLLPTDVQLMFNSSTCMEWRNLGVAEDLIYPTCFTLLPYRLNHGEESQVEFDSDDAQAAMAFATHL
eukprot:3707509-Ditylum_brightwellii.AAC.1